MKQGKVIFISSEREIINSDLEKLKSDFKTKEKTDVVFAAEKIKGFFTLSEATLFLAQRGAKKITAFPYSVGSKCEIPVFWGIS